ncbi:Thiol-disulfide oxidoreductase ResA [subsurface metagenome]
MDELDEIRKRKLKELEERYLGKKEVIDKPIQITDQTFEDTIRKYPVVVVDFWGQWCPPCHIIAPIIEELANDYSGKVVFSKLNVDKNQMIAAKYGIMAVPTLLIFKNGKLMDQVTGALPRQYLEQRIKNIL